MKLVLLILISSLFLKAQNVDSLINVYNLSTTELDSLMKRDQEITELSAYRDSRTDLVLKLINLQSINTDRAKYKKPPVKLNLLASRLANKISSDAIKGEYFSHWNLAGEKPYHRWGKLNQKSHISENTYTFQQSSDIRQSQILSLMARGESLFINEKAPYDGHKKNILKPYHTSVGLGYAAEENQFRYNQEFVSELLEDVYVKDNKVSFKLKEGYYVHLANISSEKIVKKTSKWLNTTGGYLDEGDQVITRIPFFNIEEINDYYEFRVPELKEGKAYYIKIYIGEAAPDKNRISTKNLIPASGIVIFK